MLILEGVVASSKVGRELGLCPSLLICSITGFNGYGRARNASKRAERIGRGDKNRLEARGDVRWRTAWGSRSHRISTGRFVARDNGEDESQGSGRGRAVARMWLLEQRGWSAVEDQKYQARQITRGDYSRYRPEGVLIP